MADKKIRISELPESSSTGGLFTLGVNSQNGSVKVPLGSIVDGISQQANQAIELSQQAKNTADNAVGIANEAATNAASAKTKAEEALAAANNAETRNDSQDAAIGMLQTDVEALKEGGAGVTEKWVVDLGESDNGSASDMWNKAPSRAAEPAIAGNKEIRRILFTVTDGVKTYGAFIDQNVYDASCVQMMYLNGRRFDRFINFTDNSRTEVASGGIQTWQRTDVRNVAYNQGERKVWLQNMWGQGVGGDAQLPLSTDTVDGLMPKGTLTSIAQLRSDVAALQAGGSGGGTDYSGEIASLQQKDADQDEAISSLQIKDTTHDTDIAKLQNDLETLSSKVESGGGGTDYSEEIAALNTAVEGHTSTISTIQQKDADQDAAISSLQSKDTTQDSNIEALSAKSEELEAGVATLQGNVNTHGTDIEQIKQDVAALQASAGSPDVLTVDVAAMDSLCPDILTAKSLFQHAEKMRYIVTVTKGVVTICVGELVMYADAGGKQITQELRSHYFITGSTASADNVRLDAMNTFVRSYGVQSDGNTYSTEGAWTDWRPKDGIINLGESDVNTNSYMQRNTPSIITSNPAICGNKYISRILFTVTKDGITHNGIIDMQVSNTTCMLRQQMDSRIFTRYIYFTDATRQSISSVQGDWQYSEARNLSYNETTRLLKMTNMWGNNVGGAVTIPESDDSKPGLVPAGTLSTLDYRLADVLAIIYSLFGGTQGDFSGFAPDDCVVQDNTVEIDPSKLSSILFWRKADNESESGWVVKSGDYYFKRWTPYFSYEEANKFAVVYCNSDGCYYVVRNNSIRKLSGDTGADMHYFAFIASFFMNYIHAVPGIGNFNNLDNPLTIGINDDHFILRHFETIDYNTGNRPKTAISFTTSDGKYLYQYLFAQGMIKIRTIEYTTEARTKISSVGQWRTL